MKPITMRAVASVLLSLTAASGLRAQAEPVHQATSDSVEAFLRKEMQQRGIPGMQVAVVQHGRIVLLGAYGMANVERAEPVTNQTVFALHSATKAFTGVALMQLAEAGAVDLAAPVSQYLDGLPVAWQSVTVRQLLTHTSGIPNIVDQRTSGLIASGEDAAWAKVQALPMEFAPGERVSYNQTNYLLLGRIIDRMSGRPFTQFMAERQFHVVGMPLAERAGFGGTSDSVPGRATSYAREPASGGTSRLTPVFFDVPRSLRTGAGAMMTAKEVARWLIALQRGHLLRVKTSLVTLWTPSLLNDGSMGQWAIGWPTINRDDHRAVAGIGGGRVAFYVYPDDDLSVVILTNLQGSNPEFLVDAVASFYIPAMRPATGFGLPPRVRALRAELTRRGFEHASEAVDAAKAANSNYRLDESDLNTWGYRLIAEGKTNEAVTIFKLNVRLHPEGWNTYDSLAEAYEATGDRALAIANYQQSLTLNPKNEHAIARLKALQP